MCVYNALTIALLLRTLVECPQLARYVRSLRTTLGNDREDIEQILSDPRNATLTDSLHERMAAVSLGKGEPELWIANAIAGKHDAREALLISILPNLDTLFLHVDSCLMYVEKLFYYKWRSQVLDLAVYSARFGVVLNHLRKVTFSPYRTLDVDKMESLLKLNSLQSLRVGGLSEPVYHWTLSFGYSSIKHLELHGCELYPETIAKLLSLCKNLQSFLYQWVQYWSDDDVLDDDDDFRIDIAAEIMSGLFSSQKTLQKLLVCGSRPIRHDARPLASFREFENLDTIHAPTVLMTNGSAEPLSHHLIEGLPPSLQRLHWTIEDSAEDLTRSAELLRCNIRRQSRRICRFLLSFEHASEQATFYLHLIVTFADLMSDN